MRSGDALQAFSCAKKTGQTSVAPMKKLHTHTYFHTNTYRSVLFSNVFFLFFKMLLILLLLLLLLRRLDVDGRSNDVVGWSFVAAFSFHRLRLLALRRIRRLHQQLLLGIVGIRIPNRSCCSRLRWIPFHPCPRQCTNARKPCDGT